MIVRLKSGEYQVQSEDGKPLGTYDTHAEAQKRLFQIEYWKHRKQK